MKQALTVRHPSGDDLLTLIASDQKYLAGFVSNVIDFAKGELNQFNDPDMQYTAEVNYDNGDAERWSPVPRVASLHVLLYTGRTVRLTNEQGSLTIINCLRAV